MNGADAEALLAREARALEHELNGNGREAQRSAVLADPYPMWLETVAQILRHDDIGIVGKTSPGRGALAALEELRPDVLVTELVSRSDELDAPGYIRAALACSPDTKIVVLAASADKETVHDVLLAGADAYVVKTAGREDLLSAVRQTFDGSVFLAPAELLRGRAAAGSLAAVAASSARVLDMLTPRETEILRLMADGLTNVQLARQLWLSEQTVKFHLSNIYRKLGVANRTEASRWAQVNGLLAA